MNVAARLEGLAEPGGICISGSVYEQVHHRIEVDYEDMGKQQVKNVSDPVQAYMIRLPTANYKPLKSLKVLSFCGCRGVWRKRVGVEPTANVLRPPLVLKSE